MKTLITLVALFCISGINAKISERLTITNDFLVLQISDHEIQLKSRQLTDLNICNIDIPGSMVDFSRILVTDAIWGEGEQIKVRYDTGRWLTFRLYTGNPFLHIHTLMENSNNYDVEINKLDIASINMTIGNMGTKLNVLGTGGLTSAEASQGSFGYTMLVEPDSRHSILTAWLTQKQGVGLMTPKMDAAKKKYQVKAELEFGNYRVGKKQTRDTDVLLIGLFKDGRDGLELYADHLVKAYQIKLPARPEVYCTWYHRNLNGSGASTEKELVDNARFAKNNLKDFGLSTFQIDDHWQSSMIDGMTYKNQHLFMADKKIGNGPLKTFAEANFNYPSGMEAIARDLQKEGFTAGIWFMPFSGDVHNSCFDAEIFAKRSWTGAPYEAVRWSGTCIDATHPAGESFLRKRFRRIYDWGYRYLKVDGLHTGAPSENVYVQRSYQGEPVYGNAQLFDSNKTFVECFRKGLTLLREEASDAFVLGCSATQNMSSFAPAFGLVDAMRVGPDNDKACEGQWNNVTRGADYAGNLYFLNNKVWYNDPDPYYVRESNPLNKARWMVSWQSIAGVMSSTSMQYSHLSAERLDLIKRGLPTHTLNARPVDILENEKPQIWLVGNNHMKVVGLFNWKEKEPVSINYDLLRMGLNETQEYELFDFWGNTYLGKISGRLSQILDPASCKVLAMRTVQPYPQVVSTSRHITQGIVDIEDEQWHSSSRILSGRSRVIKGDKYELRLIVPDGYLIKKAMCENKSMSVLKEGKLLRVSYIPHKTQSVDWIIEF